MRKLLIASVVATLALAPVAALAVDVRQGPTLTVREGETIDDDLYVFGGDLTIRGTVNGNLLVGGGTINVTGNVTRDVMVAGGTIDLSGRVGGSIRAAGGTLFVRGPVDGDVVVAGGTLHVERAGKIGRDLLLGTGQATVEGDIGRHVDGSAGALTLSSRIGGNVRVRADMLRLEDGAVIGGNLEYVSNREATIASGAKVQGRVQRTAPPGPTVGGGGLIGWLQSLVGIFALGLIFVLLFPAVSSTAITTLRRSPWVSLGIGAALLVGVPLLAVIVFVAGVIIGGWWLGLIACGLYLVALALAYVVAGLFAGRWVLDRVGQSRLHVAVALLAGLLLMALVALVPVVGWLIIFIAVLFGLGALAQAVAGALRPAPA